MIKKFVDAWFRNQHLLKERLRKEHPEDYPAIVKVVVEALDDDGYDPWEAKLDHKRIATFGGEDYQGDYLFIIQQQNSETWYSLLISYGSCSGCDTLERIKSDGPSDAAPDEDQINQYMLLCLHIVQGIREISEGM